MSTIAGVAAPTLASVPLHTLSPFNLVSPLTNTLITYSNLAAVATGVSAGGGTFDGYSGTGFRIENVPNGTMVYSNYGSGTTAAVVLGSTVLDNTRCVFWTSGSFLEGPPGSPSTVTAF